MLFTIIHVRRKMPTGLLNREKETISMESLTVGQVISQTSARKGYSGFIKTVNNQGSKREMVRCLKKLI